MAYSSQTLMNSMFGSANITLWGGPNGNESAGDVTTRCNAFIRYADAFIDGALIARGKGSFQVPYTTTPTIIEFISTQLAGGLMYEAWGVRDTDPKGEGKHQLSYHIHRAWQLLDEVAKGLFDLQL